MLARNLREAFTMFVQRLVIPAPYPRVIRVEASDAIGGTS